MFEWVVHMWFYVQLDQKILKGFVLLWFLLMLMQAFAKPYSCE